MGTGASCAGHADGDVNENTGWRSAYRNHPNNRGRARPTEEESPAAPDPAPPPRPSPGPSAPSAKPLQIKSVELKIPENVSKHHTDLYDITKKEEHGDKAQLVVRRGQPFELDVICDRPMDDQKDRLQVRFQIGPSPRPANGTDTMIKLSSGLDEETTSGEVKGVSGDTVTISVQLAPDAAIGRWEVKIQSSILATGGSPAPSGNTYSLPKPIVVLFNAWCPKDDVYLEDEVDRDEYVLNPTGRIWVGSAFFSRPKAWNFGQFEKDILDCSLFLLDRGWMGRLEVHARGDVKAVSRKLAALVNESDDNGVLRGNWSGEYDGGTKPTKWQGSVKILQEFYKKKKTVKFGQCWVFAGVLTAVSRAVGMPSRCVTNFSSAHDSDGSCTIDSYQDEDGKPIKDLKRDSIWNFHVWNEAFMKRPDLVDPLYSGWQAYDSTPQETSDGIYTCGPCSVQAVKMGNVGLQYDGRFVFAEVNADEVTWVRRVDEEGNKTWEAPDEFNGSRGQKRGVGMMMSTKRPRKATELPNERLDVTDTYKHREGSAEEREAVERAQLKCKHMKAYTAYWLPKDVTFVTDELKELECGKDLVFKLRLANTNKEEKRTVHIEMKLESMYNTGITRKTVTKYTEERDLTPGQEGTLVMTVKEADVSKSLAEFRDQPNYCLQIVGNVGPTTQTWFHEDRFVLTPGACTIEGPAEMTPGEEYEITCRFVNPMPRPLTNCVWQVEGSSLENIDDIKQSDIPAGETGEALIKVRFRGGYGPTDILVQFDCDQLPDVNASHNVYLK